VVGASSLCKCFEVLYKDQLYSIFQEDLLGIWSMPIRRTGRGMVRVRVMKVCA
jgi:hypothetical protein